MTVPAPVVPAVPPAAEWIGVWSRPPDRPAQVALVLGLVLLALALTPGGPRSLASIVEFATFADLAKRRRFLLVTAFAAAFLSLGYIAYYLRGGPRAPDAALYWLQGRAMSDGGLTWAAPEPSASFRAGGMILRAPDRLSGTLPPGFPLLLAPGFLVGAPMLVGPLLACALVAATWLATREMALASGQPGTRAEAIARAGVALSVLSAALRQSTADAVPYGACAVLVAGGVAVALRARRRGEAAGFVVAGLSVGLLGAMQTPAAVVVGAVVLALACGVRERGRAVAFLIGGAVPGVVLWLLANHAATGHFFGSPASVYAAGVGPPQTAHETLRETARAAVRGLRAHLVGVANLEPVALLAALPLVGKRSGGVRRGVAIGAVVVGGEFVAVLLLAATGHLATSRTGVLLSVVPLEQALVAIALGDLFPLSIVPALLATCALSLLGFALHVSNDHERVASSGIGRPRYEPDEAREANLTHGLLFFDDDEGYELAHDPDVAASHGVQAVRIRGDDHDRLLYDLLGHPQTHRYTPTAATVSAPGWTPPGGSSDTWRFEAESDFPPAFYEGAWARVLDAGVACASDGRVLGVEPNGATGTVTVALPLPHGPTLPDHTSWFVLPRVVSRGGTGAGQIDLLLDRTSETTDRHETVVDRTAVHPVPNTPVASWTWSDSLSASARNPTCTDLPGRMVEVGKATRAWLVVRATGGEVSLDKTTLRPR